MRLIFCADPLDPKSPDYDYQAEAVAATGIGINYDLISFEALVNNGDVQKAVRRVADGSGAEPVIYRGWMLTTAQYEELYSALESKGVHLINNPAAYRHAHHLPESYEVVKQYTPQTVWIEAATGLGLDLIKETLTVFGDAPIVVKDYVKSRKHEWNDAFYIPSASDEAAVQRVTRRFLELQGEDLQGGLVFREFVEFEPLTKHSRSGMPLVKEYRLFFLDGELLKAYPYWEEGEYGSDRPPLEHFTSIATQVKSRFFTMDVAKRNGGDWMIVELGDAQVAGLPDRANQQEFYLALRDKWPKQ